MGSERNAFSSFDTSDVFETSDIDDDPPMSEIPDIWPMNSDEENICNVSDFAK